MSFRKETVSTGSKMDFETMIIVLSIMFPVLIIAEQQALNLEGND